MDTLRLGQTSEFNRPAVSRTSSRWIEIPNDIKTGMSVLEAIVCELEHAGFEQRQIKVIELAFTEALANAVHHGNQDDPNKTVLIEYRIEDDGLHLVIEDEGTGFSLADVEDSTAPENIRRPGGRGLLLIRTLVDEVQFNGRGNRIALRHMKRSRAA